MRQFYEQVQVDGAKMRFYAECPNCGKWQYAGKLPLLCRSKKMLELLEQGKSGRIRQAAYNKSKASAVQYLARFFNLCRSCGKWVCDDCYDSKHDCCIYRECEAHESSLKQPAKTDARSANLQLAEGKRYIKDTTNISLSIHLF